MGPKHTLGACQDHTHFGPQITPSGIIGHLILICIHKGATANAQHIINGAHPSYKEGPDHTFAMHPSQIRVS